MSKLFSRIFIILKKIFEIFDENLEQINFGEKCYKNSVAYREMIWDGNFAYALLAAISSL